MPSTRGPLNVFYRSRLVGRIEVNDTLQMKFRYCDDWLASDGAFPVSLSMPLSPDSIQPPASHHFFANLLPEATVRERVCAKLKISPNNDFELLKAIGGDCAGALTILDADQPIPNLGSLLPISEAQLSAWSRGRVDAFSATAGEEEVRLSLAGAQDKLPVIQRESGFFIPRGDAASTHLLKFPSPYFSHLPENEAFTTHLAMLLGLPVVELRLLETEHARIAVIQRYDRIVHGGTSRRLHQEDMCQAMGISHLRKYEKEGGPSLWQCGQLIRNHCSMPAIDMDNLLRWSLFNLLSGNSDAHGKNLSILYGEEGTIALAPGYDLVCTRNYDRIDRHLAMSVGGETDPGLINRSHLTRMAKDLGIANKLVMNTLDELIEAIPAAIDGTVLHFRRNYGESPVLERLPITIRQQLRRTKALLKQ